MLRERHQTWEVNLLQNLNCNLQSWVKKLSTLLWINIPSNDLLANILWSLWQRFYSTAVRASGIFSKSNFFVVISERVPVNVQTYSDGFGLVEKSSNLLSLCSPILVAPWNFAIDFSSRLNWVFLEGCDKHILEQIGREFSHTNRLGVAYNNSCQLAAELLIRFAPYVYYNIIDILNGTHQLCWRRYFPKPCDWSLASIDH